MQELEGVFVHNGTTVYTETQPRQGLAAVMALDVSHWNGPGTQILTVKVETHNLEDNSSWDTAAVSTITGSGVTARNIATVKELWRVSFAVTGGSASTVIYVARLVLTWRSCA